MADIFPLVADFFLLMADVFWFTADIFLLQNHAGLLHRDADLLHRDADLLHRMAPLLIRIVSGSKSVNFVFIKVKFTGYKVTFNLKLTQVLAGFFPCLRQTGPLLANHYCV